MNFCGTQNCRILLFAALRLSVRRRGGVSPEFQEKHPEVPWSEMRGMRNRMIHRYDDVDMTIVWHTAQEDVPPLLALIEP